MSEGQGTQQLYRVEPDGKGGRTQRQLYPVTSTRSVFDGQTGLTLDTILRYFNAVFLAYEGTDEATRNAVPLTMRRKGLLITYTDVYGVTVNERCCDDSDKDTEDWGKQKNWVRVFYIGKEYVEAVDCGKWTEDGHYYDASLNPMAGRYETSYVWDDGCKYRCRRTATKQRPGYGNADWEMVEGDPTFTVDFEEADCLVDPTQFDITLTLIAKLHNRNIIDQIPTSHIVWSRYSLDSKGEQRTESDKIWNTRRGNSGKSIRLAPSDLDGSTDFPSKVVFTATVTLDDGEENQTEQVTYEY